MPLAFIATVVTMSGLVCLGFLAAASLLHPAAFIRRFAGIRPTPFAIAIVVLAGIGAGAVTYSGLVSILEWVPDWGFTTTNGYMTARTYIAGCAGVSAAFLVPLVLVKAALARVQRERLALLQRETMKLVGLSRAGLQDAADDYRSRASNGTDDREAMLRLASIAQSRAHGLPLSIID